MAEKVATKIEFFANLSVIAVALLGGAVLLQSLNRGTPAAPKPLAGAGAPRAGTKLLLPGVNWAQHELTVVLVLSTQCHFCTESAPFYQRLAKGVQSRDIGLIAVFPQEAARGEGYLKEMGVSVHQVIQSNPSTLGVRGTPGLILANREGSVTHAWIGRVSLERESEIVAQLK